MALVVTSFNYQRQRELQRARERQRGGFLHAAIARAIGRATGRAVGRAAAAQASRALVRAAPRTVAVQGSRALATRGSRALAVQGGRALAVQGSRALATRGSRALATLGSRALVPASRSVRALGRSLPRAVHRPRGLAARLRRLGRRLRRRKKKKRLYPDLDELKKGARKSAKRAKRKKLAKKAGAYAGANAAVTGLAIGIEAALRSSNTGLTENDVRRIVAESAMKTAQDRLAGKKVTSKTMLAGLKRGALSAINEDRPPAKRRKTVPVKLVRSMHDSLMAELALKESTFARPHRVTLSRPFGTGRGPRRVKGRKSPSKRGKARRKPAAKKRGRKPKASSGGRKKKKRKATTKKRPKARRARGGTRNMNVGAAVRRHRAVRDVFDMV